MEAYARKATAAGESSRPTGRPTEPHPAPAPLPAEIEHAAPSQPPTRRVVPRPAPIPSVSVTPSSIEGALLGAVGQSSPPVITERAIDDPVAEMHVLFLVADYAGCLELADLILAEDPGHADARDCQRKCMALLA
jgi:hypothetical protein